MGGIVKANWKTLLTLSTTIVVAALTITFFIGKTEDNKSNSGQLSLGSKGNVAGSSTIQGSDYAERLVKYLRDNGMVLYGSYQSTESKEQKDLFGDALKYLDYVECDASGPNANPDECIAQKIEIYPTWVFEGKQYAGKKSLAELAKIAGFSE